MNFAGNSQQRSDTDVFESLRKGQALADVAAALLTGTQVYCDPASSYHLFWFSGLVGSSEASWNCSITQGSWLLLSYHLTPGGACVCETWAESHSSVLLLSLSLA